MIYDYRLVMSYELVVSYNKNIEVFFMTEKLRITSKLRGADGYKTFSVRIRAEIIDKIDDISKQTGRSRNELIGMLLDFSLKNSEVV